MNKNILSHTKVLDKAPLVCRRVIVCVSFLCVSACSTLKGVDSTQPSLPVLMTEADAPAQTTEQRILSEVSTSNGMAVKSPSDSAGMESGPVVGKPDAGSGTDSLPSSQSRATTAQKKKADGQTKSADKLMSGGLMPKVTEPKVKDTPDMAAVEKPVLQAKPELIQKALLTLESLPLPIGENWLLNRESASSGRCALFYREQMMPDGQGDTPVRMIVRDASLLFSTLSNIDLSYENTGIQLDKHAQIPIEKVLNDTSIIYENDFVTIAEQMKAAQKLTLSLGFWPTWPITQAYQLDFDLSDFTVAFSQLNTCISLEQGFN